MKESFLQELAAHVLEKYQDQLDELVLVLPSRRARIFLIEAFKEKSKGASWLPIIRSMEDFIGEISELSTPDQLDLIFEFYTVYKEKERNKADSLEDFMAWANILLYDFNEIDRNLIDATELFSFLNASKALESWTPEGEELTDYQKKYLSFWEKFQGYYNQLNQHLSSKKLAYQGKLYKEAIDRINEKGDKLLKGKSYCFAGFNALTPAENSFIEAIRSHREVEMLFDADKYYLEDPMQEAGIFLRRMAEQSKEFKWLGDELISGSKEINIYGMSGDVGQAKLLAEIIRSSSTKTSSPLEKGIILADENLLIPVLESLPEEVSPINITMGYPVQQSSFYTFFHNYLKLIRQSEGNERNNYYHKDLFSFLEDPFLQKLSSTHIEAVNSLKEEGKLYFSQRDVSSKLEEGFQYLFSTELSVLKRMQRLVVQLKDSGSLQDLELEILYHFYKLFNRLIEIDGTTPLSGNALLNIYRQFIAKSNLSFVGEPLNGWQIMGVLESRTLDFKEVYICSLNEGILPSGKSQNSLIPYEIKRKFNLPTHKEKDAIFAYHFYRVLQRAEKVHLIYNNSVEGIKGAERSRFIEQLLYEMPEKNPNIKIKEIKVRTPQSSTSITEQVVEKNEKVLEAIRSKFESGLSPSSINSYLQCPLDFYYRSILGLKEEEYSDPEEGIEDSLFGTLLHDTLEVLYQDYEGELLQAETIKQISKNCQVALKKTFEKNGIQKWKEGKMKLVFEVCLSYLEKFFNWELERASGSPIHLIEVEKMQEWNGEIRLEGGRNIPLKLKGKIDRVEEHQGIKQIIDYKSGLVEPRQLNAKDLETIFESEENKYGKQIQLMIYKMLYEKEGEDEFEAGILSFRNLKSGILRPSRLETGDSKEFLSRLISEIIDPKIAFKHNPSSKYCKFCRDL